MVLFVLSLMWTLALLSVGAWMPGIKAGLQSVLPGSAGTVLAFVRWGGLLAMAFLVLRLLIDGFRGYERAVGLRIIARDRESSGRSKVALKYSFFAFMVSGALIVTLESLAIPDAFKPLADNLRLFAVLAIVVASLVSLLMLIAQRFSLFGTTSIFGVVLGVAALVLVQSVATGFQHEFERRVLGVYAHINVTRTYGLAEYRRFESWLRTIDGVEGASPFAYYAMALDPADASKRGGREMASVLVKGIDPQTASQVIDVKDHLRRGSGREVSLSELKSDRVLIPVPDRADDKLPKVIAETPDPRGMAESGLPEGFGQSDSDSKIKPGELESFSPPDLSKDGWGEPGEEEDEWEDPPESSGAVAKVSGSGAGSVEQLPTMFVGKSLMKELYLQENDVVRLVDPGSTFDHSEEPRFAYYRIAAKFEVGFQEYDSRLVYVDIKELEHFRFRGKDMVSGVDLRLTDPNSVGEIAATIRSELGPDYSVLEWHKLNESLFSSIRTQKNIITVILGLVIFVASFNVLSALWTLVIRRTSEVAIMMSMGATGAQVARVFQVTGVAIGFAGSVAGVLFGLVLCGIVKIYGYTLDPEVYIITELPVEISVLQLVWILGLALFFCFIATIPPSWRAARLRPVEGLRYE